MFRLLQVAFLAAALPAALPASGVIEAGCSGGYAGRVIRVRVDAKGAVFVRHLTDDWKAVGSVETEKVKDWWDQLDAADFEHLSSPPGRVIPDGVTCSISRYGVGQGHNVTFLPMIDAQSTAELAVREILSDVIATGEHLSIGK